jgi:hypothetical protein
MDVTVETQCSRCLKKEEQRLSLEDAQEMEKRDKEREAAQDDLKAQLENLLKGMDQLAPDLVLIQRDPSEGYKVRMLNELCYTPDAKRNKGCKARVDILMKEIFMENPKPTKPKPKNKPADKNKGKGEGQNAGEGGDK